MGIMYPGCYTEKLPLTESIISINVKNICTVQRKYSYLSILVQYYTNYSAGVFVN